MGEVCSVGVLFPTEGTAWGRGQLEAWERPCLPQVMPSQPQMPTGGANHPRRPPFLSASPWQSLRQQGPGSGWAQGGLGQARGWQRAWPS